VNTDAVASGDVAALTRRLAAHEEAAFREFHARYFDRLYQFLLIVARGQEQEAQEALQETMLRVARRACAFDDEGQFWCWLKTVARNAARDGGRRENRYRALLENFFTRKVATTAEPNDEEARLKTLLDETLDELSPNERRLVEGKYLDGSAVKELSADTGLTERAVESRLLRLRRQLRERLLKNSTNHETAKRKPLAPGNSHGRKTRRSPPGFNG
jgi:RNA polymerase sigma-70 factor (ECF subfamily)